MQNITLICTRHEELGKCNSKELYKIIERLNPEIIFEEIPPSYFDRYYTNKSRTNLETATINWYSETYNIKHIPVDSDNVPPESLFQEYKNMHARIEGLADNNGFNYRDFTNRHRTYIETYGFTYLNSIYCINITDEINDAMEKGLQTINNEQLFRIHHLWKDIHENRENEMLQNIYNYSKKYRYDTAIFTVGAGHSKSLIQKIKHYENENPKLRLKWIFSFDRSSKFGKD